MELKIIKRTAAFLRATLGGVVLEQILRIPRVLLLKTLQGAPRSCSAKAVALDNFSSLSPMLINRPAIRNRLNQFRFISVLFAAD